MGASSQVVVVVGAGPGIGLAVARRFAAEGFRPALLARDPARLDAPDLDALAAVRVAADVADEASLRAAFTQVRALAGDPSVLVYNPSAGIEGRPSEVPPAEVARGLAIGAVGAVTATQEVLPAMRAAGSGTLLFTGGGSALTPWAPMAALGMQKAALRNFVLALADDVRPAGLHAATVTVHGVVGSAPRFQPDALAEHYWDLHTQPPDEWETERSVTA